MVRLFRSFNLCYLIVLVCLTSPGWGEEVLFEDGFDDLPRGNLFDVVGAHTEYHYLPISGPKGVWSISTFREVGSQLGWRVIEQDGRGAMHQTHTGGKYEHIHPILVAGDDLWQDYTLAVRFAPQSKELLSGVVFRYRNDRCYYFFGVEGRYVVLKMVQHATAFRKPYEKILGQERFNWKNGQTLEVTVTVRGNRIEATLIGGPTLKVIDSTYVHGKIALLADVPTVYTSVNVTTSAAEKRAYLQRVRQRDDEEARLQAANPKMKLWKRLSISGFGVGRNLRFGDLNGDGQIDVLVGQVRHRGPKDRNTQLSCLTAVDFDGDVLWQIGEPDPWCDHLTSDVAFQIHDLDGDGANEVIYCMNMEIIVADGKTGITKYSAPTPEMPDTEKPPYNRTPRILGDMLYMCDLRGLGRKSDIIIKTRYQNLWALDEKLEIMWHGHCVTGHFPFAGDIDNDGKDELSMGYTLFDDDGTKLWSLDGVVKDHADGVAMVRFRDDQDIRLYCAASDEGAFFADLDGNILKHHYLGHVQNPAIANFRDDLPGLEVVSINFWGNQGIVHFYNADGDVYHDFEPCQHGSMCLPVNWTGKSEMFWVLSANVVEGGVFDGWGRRIVKFPADGHPDRCNMTLDVTGDCRDEIVVWDPHEIWVYTQDDNPKSGRLYEPQRNPLYNESNYLTSVALPGWSE